MLYDDFNEKYLSKGKLSIGSDGYAILNIGKRGYRVNKLFVFGFENYDKVSKNTVVVDHENRNILHNTMDNLRVTTRQYNGYNEKPLRINNTSGYKGVSYDKFTNKWIAQIMFKRHLIKIGRFENIYDAILMRLKAEILFCGKEYSPQRHLFDSFNVIDDKGLPERVYKLKQKYS